MNNEMQNRNNETNKNSEQRDTNILNTSFGEKTNSTANDKRLSGRIYEFYHQRGSRDQLFLVDEHNKKVYAFSGNEIYGIVKHVEQKLDSQGVLNFIELEKGIKPCYWPVEKQSSVWPQGSLEDAYYGFKEKFHVQITISSFTGMLKRSFPNDYEKFLRKKDELDSVLYDENGRFRHTTTFKHENATSPDGSYSRLFLFQNGKIFPFKGVAIRGVAAVVENIRGEMEADGRHFSTTFMIKVPEDVEHFIIYHKANETPWPQYSIQSAYKDFTDTLEFDMSFDDFVAFLKEYYPKNYERIVTVQEHINEFAGKTDRPLQIITMNTSKDSAKEPHTDISVTAPDGQKWIISYKAKIGTEIDGVCKIIYSTSRRIGYTGNVYTHEIIATDGVQITEKEYGRDTKYPSHYFINSPIHKEGSSFVYISSNIPQNQKGKKPLKGGVNGRESQEDKGNEDLEDKTDGDQNRILSTSEVLAALRKKFG